MFQVLIITFGFSLEDKVMDAKELFIWGLASDIRFNDFIIAYKKAIFIGADEEIIGEDKFVHFLIFEVVDLSFHVHELEHVPPNEGQNVSICINLSNLYVGMI